MDKTVNRFVTFFLVGYTVFFSGTYPGRTSGSIFIIKNHKKTDDDDEHLALEHGKDKRRICISLICLITIYSLHEDQLTVRTSPRLAEWQPDFVVILQLKHRLDLLANPVEQSLGYRSDGGVLTWVRDRRWRTAVVQQLHDVQ